MKTKIIYISGSEVFDMTDIRAAFDTVRNTLGLDNDTVLFGVPVDNDSAFATNTATNIVKPTPEITISETADDISKESSEQPVTPIVETPVVKDVVNAPTNDALDTEEIKKPKKTPRQRAKVVPIAPIADKPEPDINTDETTAATDTAAIPILSVLGTKSESNTQESQDLEKPLDVTSINITPIAADSKDTINIDTQAVSINDMLADDSTPVSTGEKTLEELLEIVAPLGEDEITPPETNIETQSADAPVIKSETNVQSESDDTDATLELLANEFAASADEIVTPTKPTSRRIGKLKNILPFKPKTRNHNDDGIMGDLFGWAGVANDEDFTIPGFFANASSKK